ncbi:MAG: tRNA 5-methoxyuridine(34)/uridine 5-oxyacetic acid(34) synthase CmoB [Planctomycetota bacterium]
MPDWYNRSGLDAWLRERKLGEFADHIRQLSAKRLDQPTNGDLRRWVAAIEELPPPETCRLDTSNGDVRVVGHSSETKTLRETLMCFHPWRKGPFHFLDLFIDTEWRSDWKWDRIAGSIDLKNRSVLDVGCGNGYYGWRMLAAGASFVLGFDPILRFLMQFEVFSRYADKANAHYVVPLIDSDLPEKLEAFDVAFSLGVLYHRTSPIDHLRSLHGAIRPGGTLVLETLIVEDNEPSVLVPEDRYAQMRNVWFLPSRAMLTRWLARTGFESVRTIDVTRTTTEEQRRTDWMTFQSLSDFLDPADASRTIEGYPSPVRATVTAIKR